MLNAACATEPFHQWERRITGLAVAFCCSPQSRCPCGLSLTCDHIRQLFQAQDQRSTVMNGACDLQALNRQVSGRRIVMLACRCLRKQGVDERLALLVSELLVTLQASFQQETSTRDVALAEVLRNAFPPRGAHSGAGRCATTARPLLNVPFVGRGAQVSRLMTLYEQASSGRPQVVLLEGEIGIGKTRLSYRDVPNL